ncbi:MAG TPA: hypothetical protein VFS34_00335 [Thermoanaerobaculia bacterium]|nr:hypothetical protein [Thermoanaerobaculia bacterium]
MPSPRRFPRAFALLVAVAAFIAVGFAFTRAAGSWRQYRACMPVDPSGAEVYLDGAEIWGGAGVAAVAIGGIAAIVALRRR